jgi:hypothetical protein
MATPNKTVLRPRWPVEVFEGNEAFPDIVREGTEVTKAQLKAATEAAALSRVELEEIVPPEPETLEVPDPVKVQVAETKTDENAGA